MANNMTEELAKELSKFTSDENLTLDQFIVFKDLTIEAKTKMQRLKDLKDKTFITSDERTEITTLMADLIEYMPTSADWNKFVACIMTMQMFMRDGIVIFVNQKQQEITDFVNTKKTEFQQIVEQFNNKGDYNVLTNYKVGNTIRFGGYGFICIKENINQPPNIDHDTEYWTKFTLKGDKGDPSLNVNYKGDYSNTTTYNLGDAVSYNIGESNIMYYCKTNGTLGIVPTNVTKWGYVGGIVSSTATPNDTHVFWWDKNTNIEALKRYNGTEWIGIKLDGKTAITILETTEKIDLAKAINEVNNKVATNLTSINIINNKTDLLLSDLTYQLAGGTATAIILTMQTLINGYTKTFIANSNNNGASTTINGIPLYKPRTTTTPNLIGGKAYTVWFDALKGCFFIKASAEGNTFASHVLAGDMFSNDNDVGLIGTMPNNGTINITPTTTNQNIPLGYTTGGTVRGDSNLIASNIVNGVNIFGVIGTFVDTNFNYYSMSTLRTYFENYFKNDTSLWFATRTFNIDIAGIATQITVVGGWVDNRPYANSIKVEAITFTFPKKVKVKFTHVASSGFTDGYMNARFSYFTAKMTASASKHTSGNNSATVTDVEWCNIIPSSSEQYLNYISYPSDLVVIY